MRRSTAIGKATTTTPLLDQPLAGPVYAVSGGGLPRLAFILDGQVNIMPEAEATSRAGGCRRRRRCPRRADRPLQPDLFGGKQGYLVNTRDLCASPAKVAVQYTAQSGTTLSQEVKTKTACGKGGAKHERHRG